MKTIVSYTNENYQIDLSKPLDISIPITGTKENVNAWYVEHPEIKPHTDGEFAAAVEKGASTNFFDIRFNPHAHGTHTECVGHITKEHQSVNQNLRHFFFMAQVITIRPEGKDGDAVITKMQIKNAIGQSIPQALIIRTLPNSAKKLKRQYSHTNPPYLLEEAAQFICELGIEHLLVDLPSVDREKDNGELLAHKAFWNFNGEIRMGATITEFIFVPDALSDGSYFLNLQVAAFENDASPSRPVLFKINEL
jgi:kynurenine formamidase